MKKILLTLSIVLFAYIFDYTLDKLKIPLHAYDIVILMLSALIIYLFGLVIISGDKYINTKQAKHPSILKKLATLTTLLLLFFISVAAIYLGLSDPLGTFTSTTKPSVHGYSIAVLGIACGILCFAIIYSLVLTKHKNDK